MTLIYTYRVDTEKGTGEAAVALQEIKPSLFDFLLRRRRYSFGVGLCSPADFNGKVWVITLDPNNRWGIRADETPTYQVGRTQTLAFDRLQKYLSGRRGAAVANGMAGVLTTTVSHAGYPWVPAMSLIRDAAPEGWRVYDVMVKAYEYR